MMRQIQRHSAIGGKPPATRLTNLPGHHSAGPDGDSSVHFGVLQGVLILVG